MTTRPCAEKFMISPHPDAPILSSRPDAQLHLRQLLTETSSQTPQFHGEITNLIREAGLVNLFFFLKGICSLAGPYDRLTETLHLDTCNFRQKLYYPAARGAVAKPRGFFKSTTCSHGADTWILNRSPNERIGLVNAIVDKAFDFYKIIRANFERNELLQFLYPKNASKPGKAEFVLPSRTRYWPEPSVKVLGATGAGEGGHYTGLNIDDLIGLEEIDKEFRSNTNMLQKIKWAQTNTRSLLDNAMTSWIFWVFTLYAADDVYHRLIIDKNLAEVIGYQDPDIVSKINPLIPEGSPKYSLYYRCIIEDGEPIFPEEGYTKGWYEALLAEHKWTAMAQYMNKPTAAGMVEFNALPINHCMTIYENDRWYIVKKINGERPQKIALGDLDVVMTIDPAGTDKGITAKTSRTSIGIWAMDYEENVYRIWGAVGYFSITEMFDKIFEGNKLFKGYVRGTYVEANAMQRILKPLLEAEQPRRNQYINPQPVMAKGDKVARIRSNVGYPLSQGKVWLADGYGAEFIEEKEMFPMSESRLDCLDESEKAMTLLHKPLSPSEQDDYDDQDLEYEENTTTNVVGY